ncbi:MAG: DNA glycosylase [Candidatus Omnitrophica bacterium]|nr:DNA glycosylase [Candidatus Omnitrophota bacterium]MCM8828836.1 DNA glycosylase [Candidatus Omnitrophota bacterium]
MLRRTKAEQVVPVYEQFIKKFPTIYKLSEANEELLEKILHPLGLKWRIPSFVLMARDVREKYQCRIPNTRVELTSLPGVGDYVAGAVLAIAYGKSEWVVDSNIVRIFKRYFGITTSREGRRDKHIIEIAKVYAVNKDPGRATMGILDIAAVVCRPGKPDCLNCPLACRCRYFLSRNICCKNGSGFSFRQM